MWFGKPKKGSQFFKKFITNLGLCSLVRVHWIQLFLTAFIIGLKSKNDTEKILLV